MHAAHLLGWLWVANFIANLGIVAGYLMVPFTVLRYLSLTRNVYISGAFFFITCGITHLGIAIGFEYTAVMVANHVVQFGAVIWFVLGFLRLLQAADARLRPPLPVGERDDEQP